MNIPAEVTAPGKMMVSGEYAVLQGAPALVASVDLRVRLRPRQTPLPEGFRLQLPPEATAALQHAQAACGALDTAYMLNVADLRSSDQSQKLGVGSSAAAAAAAAGMVFAAHGHDLTTPDVQQRVFGCALAGHRQVAPRGSGADVAASTLGGFVRFERLSEAQTLARSVPFPQSVVAVVVWTGQQVRTSDMLDQVEALRSREPRLHGTCMDALAEAAHGFLSAVASGAVDGIIEQTRVYGRAMDALGQAAGAPIVERTLKGIAELADRMGGAAKPSGAGGGDVALALFPSEREAEGFRAGCGAQGLHVLPLTLGVRGVRVEVEESK